MNKVKVVSMISGGGTTMEALIRAAQAGELDGQKAKVEIAGVIADRQCDGLKKAQDLKVPTLMIERKIKEVRENFGLILGSMLEALKADVVFQNGWLPITPNEVIAKYQGSIFNQHPGALDPDGEKDMDFGGKGMYGQAPTCARLAYAWVTGETDPTVESTIHHLSLDEQYDRGQIIRIEPVKITEGPVIHGVEMEDIENDVTIQKALLESVEKVKKVLLPAEHQNVQDVIRYITQYGEVPQYKRYERLIPENKREVLQRARALAKKLFPKG